MTAFSIQNFYNFSSNFLQVVFDNFINFIAYKDIDGILFKLLNIRLPFDNGVLKGDLRSNIKDNHEYLSARIGQLPQPLVFLLAGGVPQID